MSTTTSPRRLARFVAPVVAAVFAIAGLGVAQAATSAEFGRGQAEHGITKGSYEGKDLALGYYGGFWCDTSIASDASTGCEVGAKWAKAPATKHDRLFITVPLGFTVPKHKIDCPAALKCVDHPMTMDLSRLAPALAPVFGTTPEKLSPALKNFVTPSHDHYILDANEGQAGWWDVWVVGVTDPTVYANIQAHKSMSYIQNLLKAKNPAVVGPIPSNLFLFFNARAF